MTRAEMLLLSLLLVHFLLGVLSLVVSHGERRAPALALWGSGLLAYAVGALIIIVGTPLGVGFKQTLGNGLISLAGLLTASAIVSWTRFRLGHLVTAGGLLLVVLLIAVNHLRLGPPIYIVDVALPTLYSSCLYLVAATLLLIDPPASARGAARFVGIMAFTAVIIWNLRMAAAWLSLGTGNDPARADLAFSVFAIGQLLSLVATSLGLMWIEVRRMEADLKQTALTDGLTGLLNRRGMSQRFEQVVSLARRDGGPFALVLFDLDHFKRINDEHGHLAGDVVLCDVARALEDGKRQEDVLGRIGGEEFLLLLQNQDSEQASEMAERLRWLVSQTVVDTVSGPVSVTLSAGVAAFPGDGETWDRLFGAADRRLYLAKQAGRNRVVARDVIDAGEKETAPRPESSRQ